MRTSDHVLRRGRGVGGEGLLTVHCATARHSHSGHVLSHSAFAEAAAQLQPLRRFSTLDLTARLSIDPLPPRAVAIYLFEPLNPCLFDKYF